MASSKKHETEKHEAEKHEPEEVKSEQTSAQATGPFPVAEEPKKEEPKEAAPKDPTQPRVEDATRTSLPGAGAPHPELLPEGHAQQAAGAGAEEPDKRSQTGGTRNPI
jgi:hypothetical protein